MCVKVSYLLAVEHDAVWQERRYKKYDQRRCHFYFDFNFVKLLTNIDNSFAVGK